MEREGSSGILRETIGVFGVAVRYGRGTRGGTSSGSSSVCCVIPVWRCTVMVHGRLSRLRTSEGLDILAEWTRSGIFSRW